MGPCYLLKKEWIYCFSKTCNQSHIQLCKCGIFSMCFFSWPKLPQYFTLNYQPQEDGSQVLAKAWLNLYCSHCGNQRDSPERVDKFCYLGGTLSRNAVVDDEISAQLVRASAAFGKLTQRLWNERGIRLLTKTHIYCAAMLSTLFYGSESWTNCR